MAASALLHHAARPRAWVCRQCLLRQAGPRVPVRPITQGHLRKTIEAEWQWKEQAKEIKAGHKQSFLSMLEERGFVHQIAGTRKVLNNVMTDKRIAAYCGVDPTAASLHVGHLLPFMVTFWMYLHGFHAVTLLGGATAKIGDPSGRTTAREHQASATRKANMAQMHIQLKKLWNSVERMGRKHGYVREWAWRRALMNNNEWLNKLDVVEFLRVMGPAMRLGPMLSRETVKKRQQSGDGMSFAEFSYPVLQAWDWWHLFSSPNGVQLQIGGQDQFGNIVAGIDAINHIRHNNNDPVIGPKIYDPKKPAQDYLKAPYGLTVPLLTTSSGEKFGKSAGNAVWLSPEMTSSFDLYGFWVGTSDADVERYLKLFTFLPLPTISKVVEEHKLDPSKRIAQHLLAREFLDLVHGSEVAERTAAQHQSLLGRPSQPTDASNETSDAFDLEDSRGKPLRASDPRYFANAASGNKFAPKVTAENAPFLGTFLPRSLVYDCSFAKILYAAGLVASKSEGWRLVSNQGAYVAGKPSQVAAMGDSLKWTPIKYHDSGIPEKFIFDENQLMLRIGKWKIKIITIIPDEEFAAKGLTCPGWNAEEGRPEKEGRGSKEDEI
ncbi:putative tyrosyl-trna mitochondrial precursor (tyrosine-trna ligase) [Diplodia seriata]|uniref:Tyrosine--tRNA ligase n=1 Tax=Diplodia seriata TaxID=420778 RepID=A0A0G2DQR4_9PEZI|nr:putative tyrosyl-trna mitochondrial precursor (tyrosine-trna ligase) [Diplodia seriata]